MHRVRDEDHAFFLVAEWESRYARDAMQSEIDAGETDRAKRWHAFPPSDTLGEIEVMMAGEELAAVLPEPK